MKWNTQIFDMRKAATSIRELLAQRYLTTILKLYLCILNLFGQICRWCDKGILRMEKHKKGYHIIGEIYNRANISPKKIFLLSLPAYYIILRT